MKRPLFLRLSLAISFTFTAIIVHSQCLSAWKYYMPIVIANNTSSTLANYQVKVIVNTSTPVGKSKMISTGDDIRFLDSASCQPMPYWIESGMNSSSTTIWIKMPKLPSSAHRTIRMYYGNSSASAASNGDSTFLIFDDFNGSSLNTSKWTTYGQSGSASVSGGYLNLSTPSSGRYYGETIVSNSSFPSPLILEDNLESLSGFWHGLGIFNSGSSAGFCIAAGTTSATNEMLIGPIAFNHPAFGSSSSTIESSSPGTLTGIWQFSWPSSYVQNASWPGGSFSSSLSNNTLGKSVQICAGMCTESNGSLSIDWIRARVYASSEASFTNGVESYNSGLATSKINRSFFCAGDTVSVPYIITGNQTFASGNVFTAQLSDSSGSFASPASIGTLTSTSAGTIAATIPSSALGYHYQIRVVGSNPAIIGASSPTSIYVPVLASPAFSVNASAQCKNGNYFSLTNSTQNAAFYKWLLGDGNSSTNASLNYTYASTGTFTIKLYASNIAGCLDSTSQAVTVYPDAISSFSVNNTTQCFKPQNFIFTDKSSVPTGNISSWA